MTRASRRKRSSARSSPATCPVDDLYRGEPADTGLVGTVNRRHSATANFLNDF